MVITICTRTKWTKCTYETYSKYERNKTKKYVRLLLVFCAFFLSQFCCCCYYCCRFRVVIRENGPFHIYAISFCNSTRLNGAIIIQFLFTSHAIQFDFHFLMYISHNMPLVFHFVCSLCSPLLPFSYSTCVYMYNVIRIMFRYFHITYVSMLSMFIVLPLPFIWIIQLVECSMLKQKMSSFFSLWMPSLYVFVCFCNF